MLWLLLAAEDWLLDAALDEWLPELEALLLAEEAAELDEAPLDPDELLLPDAEEPPFERELDELLLELDELLELLLDELPREPEPLLELLDPEEPVNNSRVTNGFVLSFDLITLSLPFRMLINGNQ